MPLTKRSTNPFLDVEAGVETPNKKKQQRKITTYGRDLSKQMFGDDDVGDDDGASEKELCIVDQADGSLESTSSSSSSSSTPTPAVDRQDEFTKYGLSEKMSMRVANK